MDGYLKIYTKKDWIGHVRYEIGDGRGYKEIRGLSVRVETSWQGISAETIYEKGEEDSHGISVYNQDEYLASDKIPLEREELLGAMVYTKENDEEHQEYGALKNNCNDFTSGVLSAAGQKGCVGDYLTKEQKEDFRLSKGSDFINCRIPKVTEEGIEKTKEITNKVKEKVKKSTCSGIVSVSGYMRLGEPVEAYTRSCGRH